MKKMAAKRPKDPFESFQGERRTIVNDIKQFLIAVLNYCYSIEQMKKRRIPTQAVVARINTTMSQNLHSVIKSLSLLHGLYGYPDSSNQDVTGSV